MVLNFCTLNVFSFLDKGSKNLQSQVELTSVNNFFLFYPKQIVICWFKMLLEKTSKAPHQSLIKIYEQAGTD